MTSLSGYQIDRRLKVVSQLGSKLQDLAAHLVNHSVTMSIARCGVLGAVLTATFTSGSLTFSEPSTQASNSKSREELADILARAKKVLADAKTSSVPQSSKPAYARTGPAEEARARAVLDRYYAISAEAQAANTPNDAPKAEVKTEAPKTRPSKISAPPRTPPSDVFRDFDLTEVSGPCCVKYVICGGGTAAWSAIDAILEEDPKSAKDILLITEERHFPYNRTVLSKELWEEGKKELVRSEEGAKNAVEYGYKAKAEGKVSIIRGKRVTVLDVDDKRIALTDGTELHYNKLLLATGGSPRLPSNVSATLASEDVAANVSVFRTLEDYRRLKASLEKDDSGAVVIGGGFLGTELAIALASTSDKISLVVAEAGVLYKVLPRYLCEFLARRLSDIGIKVVRSAVVTNASKKPGAEGVVSLSVVSPDAEKVEGSNVVVAVGIDPDVGIATDAGLEVDAANGGIRVNDFMMVEPDVFAAGDVASFHDRSLGRRRVEHWDHAVVSGRIAGKNMVGQRSRYGLQSMFWSDLTNIGVTFTAVGLVDSRLETVSVWNMSSAPVVGAPSANDYTSGVVYFVKNSEVVGAVLWNPRKGSGSLRRARALISAKTRVMELSEQTLASLVNLEDARYRTTIRTNSK